MIEIIVFYAILFRTKGNIVQKLIDLHTHSTASDGSDTPAEIIRRAVEIGLAGIALTDHDTVSGLDEFLAEAEKQKIIAIPGVEI